MGSTWAGLLRNVGFDEEDIRRIAQTQTDVFGETVSNSLEKIVHNNRNFTPNSLATLKGKYGINIVLAYLQGLESNTINMKLIEGERTKKLVEGASAILLKAGYTQEEAQKICAIATPAALEQTVEGTKMFEPDWLKRINLRFGFKVAQMYFKYYVPESSTGPYAHLNTMFVVSELERYGQKEVLGRTNS